ncbi:uncharacterized protein PAC_17232 [Phialocephala subalpina]|uniref:ER-bound oxygenase mpaB/mpaB'/Rubber oxygenase catalytic domain-containing protein n=1 Tax=Phialocephala subalpina TaxID=576137 RepID=A0A1L7XQL8_9HELO|nr:uncharacterized protein PAC_17232 [Phialocephala subalpina]
MFKHSSSLTKNKILELMGTMEIPQLSKWTLLGIGVVLYVGLVQTLRFRSLRNLTKTYAAYLHDPYSLDYKTAHQIMKRVILYETPWMYAFGTQWALIKTYTVATGTGLLVQTRQLTSDSTVGKRAEDTGVILTEFLIGSMDSDRGSKALAKMNWMHRRYGNKIKQPELLHTLAMFVLEPIRWLNDREWRPLTELEKVAIFVYWKEIGNRMGIRDIPDTLEELEIWTAEYTKKNVYFTKNNKLCADSTMRLFLRDVPLFMRGFAQHAAVSLFEERSRLALGYEKPPRWIARLVATAFHIRRIIIRHFFLPRLHELDPLAKPDSTGRLYRDTWAFEPWYVKATVKSWLQGWFWTSGKVLPGPKYKSNGFLVEELGPVEYEQSSKEPVAKEAEEMQAYASKGGAVVLGCPFSSVGYPPKYGA